MRGRGLSNSLATLYTSTDRCLGDVAHLCRRCAAMRLFLTPLLACAVNAMPPAAREVGTMDILNSPFAWQHVVCLENEIRLAIPAHQNVAALAKVLVHALHEEVLVF